MSILITSQAIFRPNPGTVRPTPPRQTTRVSKMMTVSSQSQPQAVKVCAYSLDVFGVRTCPVCSVTAFDTCRSNRWTHVRRCEDTIALTGYSNAVRCGIRARLAPIHLVLLSSTAVPHIAPASLGHFPLPKRKVIPTPLFLIC